MISDQTVVSDLNDVVWDFAGPVAVPLMDQGARFPVLGPGLVGLEFLIAQAA